MELHYPTVNCLVCQYPHPKDSRILRQCQPPQTSHGQTASLLHGKSARLGEMFLENPPENLASCMMSLTTLQKSKNTQSWEKKEKCSYIARVPPGLSQQVIPKLHLNIGTLVSPY